MSEVQEACQRVKMIRHEYVSEGWAAPYRGRLISGTVADLPADVATKWVRLGVAVPSRAQMTTIEQKELMQDDFAPAEDPILKALIPDGPLAPGLSGAEILTPDQWPEGGLREGLTADEPVFNRTQLRELLAAGYGNHEALDAAPDDALIAVPGVGPAAVARYRESRLEALTAPAPRGRGLPGPIA